MYVLRALIICSLVSFHCYAKIKSVSISASSSDYQPKSGAASVEERLRNNIKDISRSLNQIHILDNWKVSLTESNNTADYSEYRIYDVNGTNYIPLAGKLTEYNFKNMWTKINNLIC